MDVTSLYNAEFMDHVAHPDYKYQMENPTCTHEGVNPSCGDERRDHRGGRLHGPRLRHLAGIC